MTSKNQPYRTASLLLLGTWLAILASACNGQAGNAIKSALPSASRPALSPAHPTAGGEGSGGIGEGGGNGSGIGGGGDETASADATTEPATTPPTSESPTGGGGGGGITIIPTTITTIIEQTSEVPSPTASPTGSESTFPWGWVALGALVVILLVALIARSSGRRGATRADWRTQALHAYAQGAGLVDAISLETSSPTAVSSQEWVRRWSDVDRRADAVATELHEVETGSPDPQTTQIVTDLGSSLTVLRSSIRAHAQAGPGAPAGPLTDRLQEFERALRMFRQRLG